MVQILEFLKIIRGLRMGKYQPSGLKYLHVVGSNPLSHLELLWIWGISGTHFTFVFG